MANFYRDLTKILTENGYSFFRPAKGDHEIWRNPKPATKSRSMRAFRRAIQPMKS